MPPQQSAQPISKTRRGPQINLCWALDLLQRIPGPHQQRIVSQSAAKESPSDGDAIYPDRVVMSKEELGRSTWTFLHSLAAQWPERPSKQQKKDAHSLVGIPRGTALSAAQVVVGVLEQLPALFLRNIHSQHQPVIFALQNSILQLSFSTGTKFEVQAQAADLLQVDVLTRIYPCAACAQHFGELVK